MEIGTLMGKVIKYRESNSKEKFAEVLDINAGFLKCKELLRPEETKGNYYAAGRHLYCGDREFYRTNNYVEIAVSEVKESLPLATLQDYPSSKGILIRQAYNSSTKTFSPEKLPVICLCQQPLNPDIDYTQCQKCNQVFHGNCLADYNSCPDCSLPFKRQRVEVLDLDQPKKIQKTLSKPRVVVDTGNFLDIEKYKNLDETSRERLQENVTQVNMSYQALQQSLSMEEKNRQHLRCKIICALYLSIEENKHMNLNYTFGKLEKKAFEIEAAIYYSTGSRANSPNYKNKGRSLLFNLCDERNPDFRYDILKGEISASEVCQMQSKDMASSAIKSFRSERQKKYTEEQLVLPESGEKLMVKTHKGEAVFTVNEGLADETTTDILDILQTKITKKSDTQIGGDTEEDPFNPDTYAASNEAKGRVEPRTGEGINPQIYEMVKDWTPKPLTHKLKETLGNYLDKDQYERVLSRIKFLSNK